ncbi:MAG: SCO family protein [Pseudomonadota bacterium]
MSRDRLILIALCLVGALVTAGLAWRAGVFAGGSRPAAVGGPFQLVDQEGRAVDESVLKGRWSAVFFGFTYCPDVCPTTVQVLAEASALLGPRAGDLRIVFVSVDPGRDRPEALKAWLEAQDLPAGTIGLTGSPEQVAAAARAYRVFHEKRGEGPDYQINHSTAVYLMDPRGRFERVLAYGLTPEQMADQIRAAMRGD